MLKLIKAPSKSLPLFIYTGLQKPYDSVPQAGMKTLLTAPISKASARQRAGRAGPIQDGLRYRLYTKNLFDKSLMANTPPGMLTSEVMEEVLVLKSCGFHKISNLNSVDGPHAETLLRALYELRAL